MSNVDYNTPFAPTTLIPGNSNNDTKNVQTLKVETLTDGISTLTNNTLSNLLDPVSSTDLATKSYVDTVSSPLLNTISTITTQSDVTYTASQVISGTILRTPNSLYVTSGWTSGTGGPTNSWEGVTWSPELGLFVGVSDTGGTDRVITSSDGISWVSRTTLSKPWNTVTWSPELEIFCALETSNTSQLSMTSTDGITWVTFLTGSSKSWNSIVWSPELSLFCSVSSNGTPGVITSPDGENWTTRTCPEIGRAHV